MAAAQTGCRQAVTVPLQIMRSVGGSVNCARPRRWWDSRGQGGNKASKSPSSRITACNAGLASARRSRASAIQHRLMRTPQRLPAGNTRACRSAAANMRLRCDAAVRRFYQEMCARVVISKSGPSRRRPQMGMLKTISMWTAGGSLWFSPNKSHETCHWRTEHEAGCWSMLRRSW